MFSLFRINDPYRLIIALGFLLAIRIVFWIMGYPLSQMELKYLLLGERLADGFVMYKEAFDYTGPLSALVYKSVDVVFGRARWVYHLLSTILIFINASILNLLLVRNRAFPENNYLPGFFYIVFSLAIPDFFALTPHLMSSTFILLALNNVFRRVDNLASDELFLYAGLFLGIATLFYTPSIIYFIVFLLALILFSTAILRRILLYLYGLFVPILLAFGYYFWIDGHNQMLESIFGRGIISTRTFYLDYQGFWMIAIIPGLWLVLSMLHTFFKAKYGIYESKIMQIMVLNGLAGALVIFIDVELSASQFILFLPVMAYFMTFYAINLKKKLFKWILPWVYVVSLIAGHVYFHQFRREILPTVVIPGFGFENKKLMLLDDELDGYINQKMASPFIDPILSKNSLENLNFYSGAAEMYDMINRKKPEVIIDNWLVMDLFFERFPLLERDYRIGSGNRYYLITNN